MPVYLFSHLLCLIAFAGCVAIGHSLASKHGLNPVFWGGVAGIWGPLLLPLLRLISSRDRHAD